jgi:hypothetical protein
LPFFLVRFRAFLGKGSSKNTTKSFCKKSMSGKKIPKNPQKLRCKFFLDFLGFIAVSGVSQRWECKNTAKNILQKNRAEKFLPKNRPKIQNRFFLGFVLSRYWAFLGEGTSKTPRTKYRRTNLTLVLFWPLTYPPTTGHGGHRFFGRPLGPGAWGSGSGLGLGRAWGLQIGHCPSFFFFFPPAIYSS